MALPANFIGVPADFTGEPVDALDIKAFSAFDKSNVRVEPPVGGSNTPQYQILFTLRSNPTGNPIVWTAPTSTARDSAIVAIETAIENVLSGVTS